MGLQVKSIKEQLKEAQSLLADEDIGVRKLAQSEVSRLKRLLAEDNKTSYDVNEVILEIRSGAGGDEAELFAADLARMYEKYCQKQGYLFKILEQTKSELKGIKSLTAELKGEQIMNKLKFESGVHRVQRIPETEKRGRVHTSTVSVAVLPVVRSHEFKISPQDIRVDVFRSKGHGGQGVNTTDSAVRITHLKSGIVVTCQDERSQIKNRQKALKILQAKMAAAAKAIGDQSVASKRREQVGRADRSEKIRTYNFPQDRITDHRLKKSWSQLERVLDGELAKIIKDTRSKLEQNTNEQNTK